MGCDWRGNYFLKTRFYSRVSLRPAQHTHIVNDPSGAKKGKMKHCHQAAVYSFDFTPDPDY